MVSLDATTARQAGVTLVTGQVTGADSPMRVTIESRLDGPVWPPRRQGQPAAGWSVDGFEGPITANETLAIGFASPAEPVSPPLEITAVESATDADDRMATAAGVLRGLGDPSPPSVIDATESASNGAGSTLAAPAQDGSDPIPDRPATEPASSDGGDSLPPEIESWLANVESRVNCAEDLEATAAVDRATATLEACGGVAGARRLDGQLTADVAMLERLERRVNELTERARRGRVATDALDRLP